MTIELFQVHDLFRWAIPVYKNSLADQIKRFIDFTNLQIPTVWQNRHLLSFLPRQPCLAALTQYDVDKLAWHAG